jgi:DNA-binding LacI/PurR family transcriptional regulator
MRANPRPTALLCWNDGIALEAMRTLQRGGVRVPEEVSLIGFDDAELGRWVRPTLTTVQQPVSDIGGKAAEILIRQIQSGQAERGVTLFQGKLIVRESAAPPIEGVNAIISSFAVVHPSHHTVPKGPGSNHT